MAGEGAQRGATARGARGTAANRRAAEGDKLTTEQSFAIPTVTEDDLLAFQLSHFGDDTTPHTFFVDAETALSYDPETEDDGLGYYEDGVKRTLTDEQIEMFRHSEIQQILREAKLKEEEEAETLAVEEPNNDDASRLRSPSSEASSIEVDLVPLARAKPPPPPPPLRKSSQSNRSSTPSSTSTGRKQRRQEVPYERRHKRKWETYIDEKDPVEGSLTHRRIARQLDDQRDESVDLDY